MGTALQPQELIPLRCNLISTGTNCAVGKGNKGNLIAEYCFKKKDPIFCLPFIQKNQEGQIEKAIAY